MLFFVQLCRTVYATRAKLLEHANNHDRYPCNRCDKKFLTREALNYHRRKHEKNELTCKVSEEHAFIIEKPSVQHALKCIGTLTEQVNRKVFQLRCFFFI